MKGVNRFAFGALMTKLLCPQVAAPTVDYELAFLTAQPELPSASLVAQVKPDFNINQFEEGSALEKARALAQAKLPFGAEVMNDEVRSYEIKSDDEMWQYNPLWGSVRRIYSGITLNDEERTHIEGFKRWLEENNFWLPAGYLDEHHYALRYLNSF